MVKRILEAVLWQNVNEEPTIPIDDSMHDVVMATLDLCANDEGSL